MTPSANPRISIASLVNLHSYYDYKAYFGLVIVKL